MPALPDLRLCHSSPFGGSGLPEMISYSVMPREKTSHRIRLDWIGSIDRIQLGWIAARNAGKQEFSWPGNDESWVGGSGEERRRRSKLRDRCSDKTASNKPHLGEVGVVVVQELLGHVPGVALDNVGT